jgi:hypothetical protein
MPNEQSTAQRTAWLHQVAVQAESAATVLARAVGDAVGAGLEVADDVYAAVAVITGWAAALEREARPPGRRAGWVHPDTDTAP